MAIHTRQAPPLNTALTYITYIKGTLLMQDAPLVRGMSNQLYSSRHIISGYFF